MGALAAIENQAPSQFMKDLIVGRYLDDLGDESIRDATERYDQNHEWAKAVYVNQHNGIPYHLAAVLAAGVRGDRPDAP